MLIDSVIVIAIVMAAALLVSGRQGFAPFTALMVGYAIVLAGAIIVSLAASRGATDWSTPYLAGSDGEGYFDQAALLAQQGLVQFQTIVRSNYLGYQLLLAILFLIFSPSLLVGLVANALLLLLTLGCLYRATLLLTNSPRAATLASAAFMLTSAHIFYGLMLLKEPSIDLAFGLILLALTKTITERRAGWRAALYMVVALAIIISMRAAVLVFLVVLLAFVGNILLKRRLHLLAVFVGLLVLMAPFAQQFTIYEFNSEFLMQNIFQNAVIASRFEQGDLDLSGIAGRVGSFYIALPFVAKVLLFPIPTAAQMLLPYDVWSSQFLRDHPAIFFYRNLNILWMAVVLPWILFALYSLRRIESVLTRRLLLAGAFYYVVAAIIYGGLIPRYGASALVFVYPAVGYWWDRARAEPEVRARVSRFFGHYYFGFFAAGMAYLGLQAIR
jgi:hypothetical protein